MGKAIYKFEVDCGRMGSLDGVFSATEDDIQLLCDTKQVVDFGEVLGKHSEISKEMKIEYFTKVTEDSGFIEMFESLDLANGFNPFEYLNEDDYEDEDEDDEDEY